MCNPVLARLREEHVRFERFFQAIEQECSRAESGGEVDRRRLAAISTYLGEGTLPRHHTLEDAMYLSFTRMMPSFRQDVYDLPEDHEASKREFKIFQKALATMDTRFPEAARSFVANERGHFISEEEILFPFAAKTLTAADWERLSASLAIFVQEEAATGGLAEIRDLLTP